MTEKYIHQAVKPLRIFFASFPGEEVKQQLLHQAKILQAVSGGRTVEMQQIHLTLLFVGNVPPQHVRILLQLMEKISAARFTLHLDKICYWKQNGIVSIQAEQFPDELFIFAEILRSTLSTAGFSFDKHHYKPHITLIRRANHPVAATSVIPIQWHVDQWYLIRSRHTCAGMHYVPLGHWYLN